VQEYRVSSWNELIDSLYEGSWEPGLGRYRSDFAFRGVSSADYSTLKTSLMRLGGSFAQLEHHLLRNFRKYAHLEAIEAVPQPFDSAWHWLALAQHHGLPTRMLDWSYSPFVAMHFATAALEQQDRDGLIWCVHYVKSRELLPRHLRLILEDEGANVFTAEMLSRGASSLTEFDALARDAGELQDFVVFFEPPSLDARIVNQFALFSLMSSPSLALDEWLKDHPDLLRKIIIPAELKWEVRDKLDQANITERVLFPGLDGLSSWLRRQYSPTAPAEHETPEAQTTAKQVPTEQG
jgi:hypothetical protein